MTEPVMSVPIDNGAYPALTPTADPVGELSGSYEGLSNRMAPKSGLPNGALAHCSRELDHLVAHHLK